LIAIVMSCQQLVMLKFAKERCGVLTAVKFF